MRPTPPDDSTAVQASDAPVDSAQLRTARSGIGRPATNAERTRSWRRRQARRWTVLAASHLDFGPALAARMQPVALAECFSDTDQDPPRFSEPAAGSKS